MRQFNDEVTSRRKRLGEFIQRKRAFAPKTARGDLPLPVRHLYVIKASERSPMNPRLSAIGLLSLMACAAQTSPSAIQRPATPVLAPSAAPAASSPTVNHGAYQVTVALVVDQLAAWVTTERLARLPLSGGFARLRKEGTWYQDVRFGYAITETAPGHASLYSGKAPHEHGIVANEIWTQGHAAGIVVDESTRLVTAEGERPEFGASLKAIKSEVVADRYKRQNPAARVYSLSIKDRGAVFGGGQHPDLALWFDSKLGQFVSSNAFTQRLPDWVLPAIGQAAIKPRLEQVWMPLDSNWVSEMSITNDDQPGETDYAQYGAKFPHQPSHSSQPFVAFRANPESDRMLLELGLLAIDNTPKERPVLLAISLSANDYIGHLFGPDSREAWDELLRLDTSLAWFFAELDRRRGPEHWAAVLSADHGIVPLPEVSRVQANQFHEAGAIGARPQEVTERLRPALLEKAATKAAEKALGKGEIAAFVDPYLYLSDKGKGLDPTRRAKLFAAITAELSKVTAIAKVFDTSAFAADCPGAADESLDALVCRSVQPSRGGDFFIALKPSYFFGEEQSGTNHGNAELSDRSVPLLVRAPGQAEAGNVVSSPQSFELFSRELEKLLNLH